MIDQNLNLFDPVFIVGVPRSGTTVFSVKLAEATGIAMAPETHFMPEVYWPLRQLDPTDDNVAIRAIELFRAGPWFADLELEAEDIKAAYFSQYDRSWPSLFQTILRLFAQNKGARYWGEKTPGHYRHVHKLLDWYPNCQIIFVMRDPRAVVASNMQAPFSPSYPWFIARRWHEMWKIFESVSADPRVSMVRYEDFVANINQVMDTVKSDLTANHSGSGEASVPREPEKSIQQGWRAQHLKKAAGAINTASLSRWRSQLSSHDIWVTDHTAGPGPSLCGYEPAILASSWKHHLRYFFKFPYQRLKLAIRSAQVVIEKPDITISLKQSGLLFVGKIIDNLAYLGFRFGALVKIGNANDNKSCKIALVKLGTKHGQNSSFATSSTDSEVLGLFIVAMCENGYVVEIVVHTKEQFFVAKRTAHAFGLVDNVSIVDAGNNVPGAEDSLEVYWQDCREFRSNPRITPLYQVDCIEITATSAKEVVGRIDKICEQDSMNSN